jgi:hypothetical protein
MPEVEAKPAEDAPVRVAKISALQAIVVAVITAAAGVFAGYIGKSSTQAPPPQQRWIVIDGAESQAYSVVRIVATINGVHFSYPSNSVWAEVLGSDFPFRPLIAIPCPFAPFSPIQVHLQLSRGRQTMLKASAKCRLANELTRSIR